MRDRRKHNKTKPEMDQRDVVLILQLTAKPTADATTGTALLLQI
jgi:hypothetical protein